MMMLRIVRIASFFMVCINAFHDAFAFIQKPSSSKIHLPPYYNTLKRKSTSSITTTLALEAARRRKNNNNQPSSTPEDMSGLFPGDGPYVPSGMSPEEYQSIKSKELEEISKMNFGAWGPRFKQSNKPPDGDWMVMPNLWTSGTVTNRPGSSGRIGNNQNNNNNNNNNRNIIRRLFKQPQYLFTFLKQNGPGLLLTYIMFDLLISAITMYTCLTVSIITPQPPNNPIIKYKNIILKIMKYAILKNKNFLILTWVQTLLAKLSLSVIFVPFSNAYLERMNRRKLWTKRKTIVTTTLLGFVTLTAWAIGCTWMFDTFYSLV